MRARIQVQLPARKNAPAREIEELETHAAASWQDKRGRDRSRSRVRLCAMELQHRPCRHVDPSLAREKLTCIRRSSDRVGVAHAWLDVRVIEADPARHHVPCIERHPGLNRETPEYGHVR